jgi:hypothetical protein
MATGTKLQGVVISGIRHGINDTFAFWDIKELRLIVTDVSEQPIAPSSRVQQSNYQYTRICCVTFQKREVLLFIVAFRKVYLNIRQ